MRIILPIFLVCSIPFATFATTVSFNKENVQKECVQFLSKENSKGFKVAISTVINDFIEDKLLEYKKQKINDDAIRKIYLELLLISLRSCYIIIEKDYSDVKLSEEYGTYTPQRAAQISCLNLLDLAKAISEIFLRQSMNEYTKEEAGDELVPLVEAYHGTFIPLPAGSIDYFDKITFRLKEWIKEK